MNLRHNRVRFSCFALVALALLVLPACDEGSGEDTFGPSVPRFLTVRYTGFTPHVGQLFKARIVEVDTGEQVGCAVVTAVPGPDFTIEFSNSIVPGQSYHLDFYADLDGSGDYSPPRPGPIWDDHSWRITFGPVQGNSSITFAHDTNWVDIAFPDGRCS